MYRGRMKRWVLPGMLAILLLLIALPGCGQSTASGTLAPDFSFPTIGGETVALSQLRGQPVLLNFWSVGCPPCIAEMPQIRAAFQERGGEARFVAVHLGGGVESVRQFAEGHGLSFTIAVDSGGESWTSYNIRGIPVTFFIDEEGTIRHTKIGPFQSKEEIVSLLDGLFKKSA